MVRLAAGVVSPGGTEVCCWNLRAEPVDSVGGHDRFCAEAVLSNCDDLGAWPGGAVPRRAAIFRYALIV